MAENGIELEIAPLFSDEYVEALYGQSGRVRQVISAFARRIARIFRARKYDAVWIEKEVLPWLPAFIENALLPTNLPIIVDYDDAVFHRYDQHKSGIVRTVLGQKLDRVMARADLVIAGNDYLAERAIRAKAKSVEIVPTVVDLDRYKPRERPQGGQVTIGWIGTPNTARYLDIVKPVFKELAARHSIRVIAVGARPDQVSDSVITTRPWTEATEVEELRDMDIGIMPLDDTPWERGKCGYKLIQYMALGLPVVASPVGANRKIVHHGENGFWAETTTEWSSALERLALNYDERRRLGKRGRLVVEEEYSLRTKSRVMEKLFRRFEH